MSIEPINMEEKLSLVIIAQKVNELVEAYNALESSKPAAPKSAGDVSIEQAERFMIGDLMNASHKDAATSLGLSYGQIYSARKGYTFKALYKKREELLSKKDETPAAE